VIGDQSLDVIDEIGRGIGVLLRRSLELDLGCLGFGDPVGLGVLLFQHLLQNEVAAREGRVGVLVGVVLVGDPDDPGEHRALGELELAGRLPEICLGRRFDPVGPFAEIDGVEIPLEDLGFGQLRLELAGQCCLVDLPLDRLGGRFARRDDDVLDVLLGDRGPTLADLAAGRVRNDRPQHGANVHTVVLVEALVLDRDHGLLQVEWHLLEGDDGAVLFFVKRGDEPAIGRVDLR
jgi:hypothetical protein